MSEIQHKKAKLVKVLEAGGIPVDIQLYLESEYGAYVEEELEASVAYLVLRTHFEEVLDETCPYYLFEEELYQLRDEEGVDPYDDIIQATLNLDESIDVECKWYNGGASWEECVAEALDKLHKEEKK